MRTELAAAAGALAAAAVLLVPGLGPDPAILRPVDPTDVPGIEKVPNQVFWAQRAFPLGEIPAGRIESARLAARERPVARRGAAAWTFRGPTNIGGRITDLAVDPTDADVVFAATAEGGVIRTLDGGASWTPLFDDQPSLSMGAVAIAASQPATIYAGTGEPNGGAGSVVYGGTGVYRSDDRGDTWTPVGLEATGAIGRIRVDPQDPDRVFVAAVGDLWGPSTDRGVYRSLDGGATWEKVLYVNTSTGAVDLVMRPDDPDVLFATTWTRFRRAEYFDYGGSGCAVYRSDDGGDTWSIVGGGLRPPSSTGGRIGISLCDANPDVMHVADALRTGEFNGLYRSVDGGVSWDRVNDGAILDVYRRAANWCGNVRTNPVNGDEIWVLGIDIWRSVDAGDSWQQVTGMHVDHHAMAFGPGPSPRIYEGNDGGVHRSDDNGVTWELLPDQPIAQAYRLAVDPDDPDRLTLGLQDNGTQRTVTGSTDDWQIIAGGDGMQPLVRSDAGANDLWAASQYENLYYSANDGVTWFWANNGIALTDRMPWNLPHVFDPTDSGTRYCGTHRVYRNTTSTSWEPISGDLTGGTHLGWQGQVNGVLTAINASPVDGDVIWTGSDDGVVSVTVDGGATWTEMGGPAARAASGENLASRAGVPIPERWVTAVRPDPVVRERCYVTVSGFRWNESMPRVYRTDDLGATWASIAGDLPDAPANDLAIDPGNPDHLFVATDVGVFETHNGGASWVTAGEGLPNVVTSQLLLDAPRGLLHAGTFGRGFWTLPVSPTVGVVDAAPSPAALRVSAPVPSPTTGATSFAVEADPGRTGTVDVITVSGRRVWTGRLRTDAGGRAEIRWPGHDHRGDPVASGVYYARVALDGGPVTGRSIVVRR